MPQAETRWSDVDALDPPPDGRRVRVPGRGTFYVRDIPGPPGAPTLVLIHGWLATGGLNWFRVFEPLSRHFRVIAPDVRGHGRGLKTWRRFRLEDCADDIAAILRRMAAGPAIVAGYSMGGPISQLLWKRHSPLVSGLVQCATSDRLTPGPVERVALSSFSMALGGATRLGSLPAALPRWIARQVRGGPESDGPVDATAWAAGEVARHDLRMVIEAGYAISQYDGRGFTGSIKVPTAVVMTLHDRAVLESSQRSMARRIPAARIFPIPDGHIACSSESFAEPLLRACLDVSSRIEHSRGSRPRPAAQTQSAAPPSIR